MYVCMSICVWISVCCICGMCMWMYRPEVNPSVVPQLTHTTGLELIDLGKVAGQWVQGFSYLPLSVSQCFSFKCMSLCQFFFNMKILGDQTGLCSVRTNTLDIVCMCIILCVCLCVYMYVCVGHRSSSISFFLVFWDRVFYWTWS